MQDFETLCFQNRADWIRLLAAYAIAEEAAAAADAEAAKTAPKSLPAPVETPSPLVSDAEGEESATGWVSRVSMLDGVDAAQLSTLHGRVIALGYLKFKLVDRQVGLRYRLTPAGRQMAQTKPEAVDAAA